MKYLAALLLFQFPMVLALGQRNDLKTFNFPELLKTFHNIQLSDIVSDIKYIPLETTEKCLIGESPKVIPAGDFFLVSSENSPLYLFDRNGRYVRTIGSIGKGPGEYSRNFVCFFDDTNQEVLICSSQVFAYSLSGKFLRKWKLATRLFASLTMFDNNTTLADCPQQMKAGSQLCRSFVFDSLSNIVPLIPDQKEMQWKGEYQQVFSSTLRLGSRYLYLPPRSDTLFELKDKKLIPIAFFQLGSKKTPDQYFLDSKLWEEARMKDYISSIYLISMDANRILMRVYLKGQPQIGILDFRKNELRFVRQKGTSDETRGIFNNFDGGLNLFPASSLISGEYCRAIPAIDLIESYNKGWFKNRECQNHEKNASMLKMIQGLKDNDNPVIIRYVFN